MHQSIEKMIKEEHIEWQDFRDKKLYTSEIRLLFTMNEKGLRAIYTQYCNNGKSGKLSYKPYNAKYMMLQDCI